MKKTALLFLLALSGLSVSAQQTVNFKIAYKPNTTYKQTTVQTNKTAVSYGEGMEPMESDSKSTITSTIKTGKPANGEYSLISEMSFDKDSQEAASLPAGVKLIGKVKNDGSVQIDSLVAPGMEQQMKDVLKQSMKANLTQMMVAEKKVKVGETFTQNTPTEMPMGPVTVLMDTKTTYKLTKVEGKKAFFDVAQTVTMTTKVEGQDLKGSGTGSGTMVYDIDNNFPLENNNSTTIQMNFEAQGMAMNLKVTTISNQTTAITANK